MILTPERYLGCAGWSIPKAQSSIVSSEGTHLTRYARLFDAVEINSSFYRPHLPKTYQRWAESVPPGFRFAAKMPKQITHERRLAGAEDLLGQFIAQIGELGEKLGPILVQLPPSLRFDAVCSERFFAALRESFAGQVACEPRHSSWFDDEAEMLLERMQVARVAADPALSLTAAQPGAWRGFAYYRLHGSPRIYYSAYGEEYLSMLAERLASITAPAWCIFDNTAEGAAIGDALAVKKGLLHSQ